MEAHREKIYRTSDWPLAVSLFASAFPIHSIEWAGSQRAVFLFHCDHKLEEAIDAFWNDRMQTNPKLLLAKAKELKSRLNGERL